jgi:hypothetical protein
MQGPWLTSFASSELTDCRTSHELFTRVAAQAIAGKRDILSGNKEIIVRAGRCLAIAGLGGLVTAPQIPTWYAGLVKPS